MAKKASEGGGVVWCHDSGSACIVHMKERGSGLFFARAQTDSPVYDAALAELSDKMNEVLKQTQTTATLADKNKGLEVGFLKTGAGFLPVWKRDVGETEKLHELVDVATLTHLDEMTFDEMGAYLKIQTVLGGDGTWYTYHVKGGVIHCSGSGMACFATVMKAFSDSAPSYFPKVGQNSPVYNAALAGLSDKLNDLVAEAQSQGKKASARDPKAQIGLVITGFGLLPVWKIVCDEKDLPAGSIELGSMTSDEQDKFLKVH